MNILFITQSIVNPVSGGVQRVTYTLGEEFERRGHSVFFLAVGSGRWPSDNNPRQMMLPNRAALSDKANYDFFTGIIQKKNIHFIINQVGIFPEINNFLNNCDRGDARLIAVHHNCVKCLNVRYREIVLGNRRNSRFLKSIDFPVVWRLLRVLNRIKYGNYFRRAALSSDKLVLLAQQYIPELKHLGVDIPPDKVTSIGNPLSFEPDYSVNQKHNRIIFVGRLSLTQKRVDKLLQIWKVLHEEFTHWEFDVVGDGSERKWMENFAVTHSLNRIHFHGVTDPRPFLKQAKYLTITSDFEGYPMVLVEAQSYGVIPVAYHSFSALTDLVMDGKTGFIVNDNSIEAYVKRMTNILQNIDDEQFHAIGEEMKKKVMENTTAMVAEKWEQLFEELNAN